MSWEADKGMLFFLRIMDTLIILCIVMGVRHFIRQKRSTNKSQIIHKSDQDFASQKLIMFVAILCFAGNTLILCLRQFGMMSENFEVPQIFPFSYNIYEKLGIVSASIIQLVLSLLVIVLTIRSMIKKQGSSMGESNSEARGE